MSSRKFIPWTNEEVRTFLSFVVNDHIQSELDGATCNEKIYQEVSDHMAAQGYNRTAKQCHEKLKKMKSDYRAIKDHNGHSGASRKEWKWYEQMDALYGHWPASNGRDIGLDTATQLETVDKSLFTSQGSASLDRPDTPASVGGPESVPTPLSASSPAPSAPGMSRSSSAKRKRCNTIADLASVMAQSHADEMRVHERMLEQHERLYEQREQHHQELRMLAANLQLAQEQEAAFRRDELTETASFN
ncbi:uncharacterized protein KZ484_006649 [Pholidichthys leucotaenia]